MIGGVFFSPLCVEALRFWERICIFAGGKQINWIMTTMEMNAEMLRNMSIIAEDENLLKRAVKYLRKLAAEKEAESALMTEEEFFARVDEAKKGASRRFDSVEDLDRYISSL